MDYGKPSTDITKGAMCIHDNFSELNCTNLKRNLDTLYSVMTKCPECGSPLIKTEFVAYATYDGPSRKKTRKRCLACGWNKLGDSYD